METGLEAHGGGVKPGTSLVMAANRFSSAFWHVRKRREVGWNKTTTIMHFGGWMKAPSRWRSGALADLHQALEA